MSRSKRQRLASQRRAAEGLRVAQLASATVVDSPPISGGMGLYGDASDPYDKGHQRMIDPETALAKTLANMRERIAHDTALGIV